MEQQKLYNPLQAQISINPLIKMKEDSAKMMNNLK
jgi:hypothetical protein